MSSRARPEFLDRSSIRNVRFSHSDNFARLTVDVYRTAHNRQAVLDGQRDFHLQLAGFVSAIGATALRSVGRKEDPGDLHALEGACRLKRLL